jgi:hypothetical protein
MASHVERVTELLDRLAENSDVPKTLREDVQWAYDVITSNKLYAGSLESSKLSEERPEIKAWTDMIYNRNIPVKKADLAKALDELNAKSMKKKGGKKKGIENESD